jgi:hypothetical protein
MPIREANADNVYIEVGSAFRELIGGSWSARFEGNALVRIKGNGLPATVL